MINLASDKHDYHLETFYCVLHFELFLINRSVPRVDQKLLLVGQKEYAKKSILCQQTLQNLPLSAPNLWWTVVVFFFLLLVFFQFPLVFSET